MTLSSHQSMLSIHLLRYWRMSMGNESSYSWSTCSRYLQSSIWSWHHCAIFWGNRAASWVSASQLMIFKTPILNVYHLKKAAKWWQQWALMKFKVLLKSTSPFFFTTQSQLLVYRNQKCWLCNYYCALPPELIQVIRCSQCQQVRQTSESCVKHVYN